MMAVKRQVLPPLPDAVPSQLGPVPVIIEKKVHYRRGGKKVQALGRFDMMPREIRVSSKCTPIVQWQTLFHEWVHCVIYDAGLHNAFSEEQQETICDVIATARVAEMLAHLK